MLIFCFLILFSSSLLFSHTDEHSSHDGTMSVDEARGLYSLLENIQEQKSLFPEEVTAKNLKALLKPEYEKEAVLYEKNPYALNLFNCLFIEIKKNNLIGFDTYVSTEPSLTYEECTKLVNEWNNNHTFATVSYSGDDFYIQYYLTTKGGIHADNLNDTIEWVFACSFHFENYVNDYLKNKAKQ